MSEKDEWQRLVETRKIAEYWIARCSRAEKQLEQCNWISVKDMMPEEGVNVLVYGRVYAERNGIDVDYVDENGDFYYYDKNVTHWMPLPSTEGLSDET